MEPSTLIRNSLILVSWLPLATCGHGAPRTAADPPALVIAMTPTSTAGLSRAGGMPPPAPALAQTVRVEPFPEDMIRHPGERFQLMLRLRLQILQQTREMPGDRWWGQIRPTLRRKLEVAGLAPDDAEFVLSEVDRARR